MSNSPTTETRVAVLVDCDNVSPEILEHALRMVAQFGRVVLRRGFPATRLPGQQMARRLGTPVYAVPAVPVCGWQNTADIALALDLGGSAFDEERTPST